MKPRIKRAARLVEMAEKAENAARAQAAAAAHAVTDAKSDAQRAEQTWIDVAKDFATGVKTVTELQEQAAYLGTLRRRSDSAAKRVEKALEHERACAAIVVRAATEKRKLELWRDRIVDAVRVEEQRLERLASDALAARISNQGET